MNLWVESDGETLGHADLDQYPVIAHKSQVILNKHLFCSVQPRL